MTSGGLTEAVTRIVVESAVGDGPWTLGWDFLVAVGTIGLAIVTGYLAWATKGTADAARDEQSAAWRPVVLPDDTSGESEAREPAGEGLPTLHTVIVNRGNGPAFDVSLKLATRGGKHVVGPLSGWQGRESFAGILAVMEQPLAVAFVLEKADDSRFGELLISYRDLSGRLMWTASYVSWSFPRSTGGQMNTFQVLTMGTQSGYGERKPSEDAIGKIDDTVPSAPE